MKKVVGKKRLPLSCLAPRVILIGVILASCASIFSTPIGKITEDPRTYAGKTVTISGEVTDAFGFLVIKYFTVRDRTGEIAVITEKPLPKKDTRVRVKGKVQEAFSLGDQQLIVIVEDDG
jgi:hypothetical protein